MIPCPTASGTHIAKKMLRAQPASGSPVRGATAPCTKPKRGRGSSTQDKVTTRSEQPQCSGGHQGDYNPKTNPPPLSTTNFTPHTYTKRTPLRYIPPQTTTKTPHSTQASTLLFWCCVCMSCVWLVLWMVVVCREGLCGCWVGGGGRWVNLTMKS